MAQAGLGEEAAGGEAGRRVQGPEQSTEQPASANPGGASKGSRGGAVPTLHSP